MLDRERSLALAQKLNNRRDYSDSRSFFDLFSLYQPQCCWHNAVHAMRLYHKWIGKAVYVEGWCAMPDIGLVQPHGWIELEDGTILDPTYAYSDYEEGKEVQYEYFPALRYTLEELKGVRTNRLPIVTKTGGFGGLRDEAYKNAYEKAYARIGIDVTTTYSEAYKNLFARVPSTTD